MAADLEECTTAVADPSACTLGAALHPDIALRRSPGYMGRSLAGQWLSRAIAGEERDQQDGEVRGGGGGGE